MLRNKAIAIILILCFYIPTAFASKNDFDKVCGYFSQLQAKLKHKSMTHKQRTAFMNHLIEENFSAKSPISQSWHAILSAVPNQRYILFKETAKEAGKLKDWHCAPMKTLYPTVGY